MAIPVIAYYVLTALGGLAIGQGDIVRWLAGTDDSWSDAKAFNDRMRTVHSGILQLNNLFAQCKVLYTPEQAANLAAWRSYVQLWAAYYKEVGTKTFDPNPSVVQDAKTYAENLAKWMDVYQSTCGSLPTGVAPVPTKDPEQPTSWASIALWLAGIGAAAYVAGNYLNTRHTRDKDD